MSGMILKLARKETFYLNGSLVQNGDRRAELKLCTSAKILRSGLWLDESKVSRSLYHRLYFWWQQVVAGIITDVTEIEKMRTEISSHLLVKGEDSPYAILKLIAERIRQQ